MNSDTVDEAPASVKVKELEEKLGHLQKEKSELEKDFGIKRAKFRELFLQKEDELKKEHERWLASEAKVQSMGEELLTMRAEMDKISWELEGVRTAAAVSEGSKQEEINRIISNYQQEVASLQQLLKEAAETASDNAAAQYESERNKLVSLNENYEEEIQELRNKLSQEKESFLSAVTKSIKRMGTIGSLNTSTEQENLEESMRKAEEEAQILKSVVVPLESEIKALKAKLVETEVKLAEALRINEQIQGSPEMRTGDTGGSKSPTLPALDSITDLNLKVEKLFAYLRTEKAARKDLEMYVAVLNTQKTMLQSRADEVSSELQNVCRLLEDEKQSHEALKQTWQMANDQFLESQRLLMMDLRRMEGVLTTEQERQIAEMQEKDETRVEQEKKIKELAEKRRKQEQEQEERKKLSQSRIGKERKKSQEGSKADSPLSSMAANQATGSVPSASGGTSTRPSSSSSGARGVCHSASSSDIGDDLSRDEFDDDSIFLDSSVHESQSLNETEARRDSIEGMTCVRLTPDKVLNLPPLTAAQMKAITGPTSETEAYKSIIAGIKSKSGASKLNMEGKRIVSEKEWALLQEEMKASREKLGQPCKMCGNYEAQLQIVQEELHSARIMIKQLERSLESERQANANLLRSQSELQLALKNAAENAESQISDLTNRLQDCEKCVKDFREQMSTTQHLLQDHCKTLTENREEIQRELTKLQDENDSLVDKYSKTAQQLQNENINLPSSPEEMQLLLLKYREEIISAKVAKEHTEETLKSEIMFLKSQVMGEQQEKGTLEETLTHEINSLQSKISDLDNVRQELEQEATLRAEAETKLRDTESSLKGMQAKSKQILGKMQEKVEELDKRKSKLETENHALRSKVHSLQVDLTNSEAVQRDFVKLSQSLQIQLEKIRQAENEVRWQHEDDIDDCNNCKQPFTVTKRKHHCRHCGKIFCADCTTKTVPSGPNFRPAKVCDVCHTILVKDATPYFSTEPPPTPN